MTASPIFLTATVPERPSSGTSPHNRRVGRYGVGRSRMRFALTWVIGVEALLCCSVGCRPSTQAVPVEEEASLESVRERLRSFEGLDPDAVFKRMDELRMAVSQDDADTLARMINYPIETVAGRRKVVVESAADFKDHYQEIMTPEWKRAILGIRNRDIFVNWRGLMVLDGHIWFDYPQISIFDPAPLDAETAAVTDRLEYLVPRGREIVGALSAKEQASALARLRKHGWVSDEDHLMYKVYRADLNNDGHIDSVVVSISMGSGVFSQIDSVWSEVGPAPYRPLPLAQVFAESFGIPESDFEWCDVQTYLGRPFLVRAQGRLYFGFNDPVVFYLWEGDRIVKSEPVKGRL